jgi:predicted tellurium resistance membrane protein TerC
VDFLLTDLTQAAFWIAALKIIGINIILSGDNAVVIALACRMLPPKERFWGMVLGAGVACSCASSSRSWSPRLWAMRG